MRTSYTTLILIKLESMALCYQTTKNLCWWEATFIGIERDAYGIACQIDLEDTIFIMYDNDKSITLMHSDGSFIISFKAPSKKYFLRYLYFLFLHSKAGHNLLSNYIDWKESHYRHK